jgi:endonuclease/exonuclease/phosphatase family metal-dependent hydrolase
MRIVTYNIRGWRTLDGEPNLHQLIAALQTIGGDVVGLNEVFYPRAVAGESRPALAMLAEALGMHYVFGPCLRWPAQDDMPATAYGNAILSRWPVIASAAHHLTSKEEDPQGLLLQREQRGLLEARILLPGGQTFTVYQTHLDHHGETTRAIQLRIARTWLVRDRNRPHLVMGDFNTVSPWDFAADPQALAQVTAVDHGPRLCAVAELQAAPQMEKAGYVDLYRRFGAPGARTFLPSPQPLRVDFIFASQTLAPHVTDCAIWPDADGVSDHRPVYADLTLP